MDSIRLPAVAASALIFLLAGCHSKENGSSLVAFAPAASNPTIASDAAVASPSAATQLYPDPVVPDANAPGGETEGTPVQSGQPKAMTPQEESSAMPQDKQANDHSTPALDAPQSK